MSESFMIGEGIGALTMPIHMRLLWQGGQTKRVVVELADTPS